MQENIDEARPRAARDDKRDAIIRTALAAFLTDGYAATSMSSVAAKVGGSKATLYNYFKSKEELFTAICERKCEQFQMFLHEAEIESGGDLKATLTSFGERFVAFVLSDDSVATFRMAIAEAERFPEIGQAIYNSGVRQNQRRMTAFLGQAKDAGQLRDDADVTCAAEQFLDLCLSGLHRRRLWNVTPHPSREEIHGNVARAVETFMRAYAVY
ncbi:MAG TPA: TetR/AcrR family transcriptional regulator [Rhizomicrobium sp.]|nr:TetR/AcrR family transcriptional regulator [Rhizomicrobium sp.]